ncbi:acetyl-CoA carboxylase [Lacticaseibacillus paracasei]|uniref:acetyl-CoA carboxylase n=1 Tax=Lacticaseibacillus paracasei TaxID=1597 RepID=UPI002ADEE689|nr:acetyl-CoA carboxylase [Lacticaseibacillus paracasei]MEA0974411.1 acetyl-CoA carboxylase [Lacticaseibacillus paracasei]
MNSDIEIIKGRLTLFFKRRPQTRYWLMLTNDTYDQIYNLFFNSQRANQRLQSVPLHKLAHYNLANLEKLLKTLRQNTTLTIELVGFTGERWPASQKLIQRKRVLLE